MHEMGLADAMMKMVDGIVKDEELTEVSKITLEIGYLSGVVPKFMQDCWEAVASGTQYENTVLVIETISGTARCEDCGEEFTADLDNLTCPKCHGHKLTPLTGRDMTIKEIEAM